VISVVPVPDGPFGRDLQYGRPFGMVNAVIHQCANGGDGSIHELCTTVESGWTSPPTGRYPPIANISTLGSSPVASVRSSE
jgi:hypothetical protein